LRILHLIQKKQLRGAEIFASQLSNHLQERGHRVQVVALCDGDAVLPFHGTVKVLGAKLNNRFMDWSAWKKLAELIQQFSPDVVQANAGDTLKYAVLSKLFFGWKQPIVFRNASMMSLYLKSKGVKWLNQQLLRRAAHIASVSAFTKNDMVQHLAIAAEKISVLPVGVEAQELHPELMDPSQLHLVHVGGFSFEKNHKGLLRIFKQVYAQLPQTKLWLLGDGKLLPDIKLLVEELELQDAVVFKGNVGNPLDYIASADVLVLPSIIEGLPAVVLEAFQCQTPVVAYDSGGIAELVQPGTGWLVGKDDEAGFTAQLILLLQEKDSSAVKAKTEAAFALVQERYLNTVIAKDFETLYLSLQSN
jgi:glycosyltransferase involved in cell wall biosynthesis